MTPTILVLSLPLGLLCTAACFFLLACSGSLVLACSRSLVVLCFLVLGPTVDSSIGAATPWDHTYAWETGCVGVLAVLIDVWCWLARNRRNAVVSTGRLQEDLIDLESTGRPRSKDFLRRRKEPKERPSVGVRSIRETICQSTL